jgi:hypothetical protein
MPSRKSCNVREPMKKRFSTLLKKEGSGRFIMTDGPTIYGSWRRRRMSKFPLDVLKRYVYPHTVGKHSSDPDIVLGSTFEEDELARMWEVPAPEGKKITK